MLLPAAVIIPYDSRTHRQEVFVHRHGCTALQGQGDSCYLLGNRWIRAHLTNSLHHRIPPVIGVLLAPAYFRGLGIVGAIGMAHQSAVLPKQECFGTGCTYVNT